MNNTTKATGRISIHCAQSSDDDLDFLYYSNRCNGIKGRSSSSSNSNGTFYGRNHNSNPLSLHFKTKSVSPFEPLAKDRNYDGINGGGKISPLPQNEYEIWAKRKRDIQNFRPPSFHHSHFRPVVLSQNDKEVGNEGNGEVPMSSNCGSVNCNSVTYQGEGCNREQIIMSLESVEKLKLENEYLQKKVERLERLLHHHQQQQQHQQNSRQGQAPIVFSNHTSPLGPMSKDRHNDVVVSKR